MVVTIKKWWHLKIEICYYDSRCTKFVMMKLMVASRKMADDCCGLSDEVGFRRCCGGKAAWTVFVVDCADVDSFSFTYNVSRTTLLRNFCQSLGIQLLLRDYIFDQHYKQTFNDEDIMNIYPIVKHLNPQASDAYKLFSSGQTHISMVQI